MTLPPEHLKYANRRYGMDHDRYDWSILPHRKPITWPNGARIALLVTPALEWFPLNMSNKPFAPPGAMVTAYPDLRHYTLRDYGNRVGIYRLIQAFEHRRLRITAAVNAAVVSRYPALMTELVRCDWEIICHGLDMDHLHHGGLASGAEAELIDQSLNIVATAAGHAPRGWLSPAKSESWTTPDLLRARGVEYICDWDNDDMPYRMKTASGSIFCMPYSSDIDDFAILIRNHHSEREFIDQIADQFDALYSEASRQGGRIMSISLRPWISGQPFRIGALETALDYILKHDGVWSATAAEILDAWKAQA